MHRGDKRGDGKTTQGCAEKIMAVLLIVIRHGAVVETTGIKRIGRALEGLCHEKGGKTAYIGAVPRRPQDDG